MEPVRKAEAVRRSLAVFFVTGGVLAYFGAPAAFSRNVALMLGLPAIALGIGIWRYWTVARWAGMGACFLMMIGAFATPLVMAGALEYHEFANPRRAEYLGWAFAGAFGLIGYWGLQYFRAPATKESYAHSAEMLATFRGESSSVVVTAALSLFCFWLLPVGIVWSEQADAARTPANDGARKPELPDFVVSDLCMDRESQVNAIVANHGARSSPQRVQLMFSGKRDDGKTTGRATMVSPAARSSGLVRAGWAVDPPARAGYGLELLVTIDSANAVKELDETNNTLFFPLVFKDHVPFNLRSCPELPDLDTP
jgi:hypothetical protein